eukprot:g1251.t1
MFAGSYVCSNAINGILTDHALTGDYVRSDGLTAEMSVGQKCPWLQIDLGSEKVAFDVNLARLRRLLFTQDMTSGQNGDTGVAFVPWLGDQTTIWQNTDASLPESKDNPARDDGFRVSVATISRTGGEGTTCMRSTSTNKDHCRGTTEGDVCPDPATAAMSVCETVTYGKAGEGVGFEKKFRQVMQNSTLVPGLRDVEVSCSRSSKGRYVVIDLPGVMAKRRGHEDGN